MGRDMERQTEKIEREREQEVARKAETFEVRKLINRKM